MRCLRQPGVPTMELPHHGYRHGQDNDVHAHVGDGRGVEHGDEVVTTPEMPVLTF